MNSRILLAAALTLLVGGGVADASTFDQFTITSPNDPTLEFTLPQSPTPSSYFAGISFYLDNVSVAINGVPAVNTLEFIHKGAALIAFADLTQHYSIPFVGGSPQLYSGPESNPTFISSGVYIYDAPGLFSYTVTVTATPLPATWAMLFGGLAGFGFLAYRGARNNAAILDAA
jgi:hypothetical protein